MAACRLAAKGKTMADSSYDLEVKSIQDFLNMQKPAPAPVISPSQIDINPDDMVAPRFLKKLKSQKVCLLIAIQFDAFHKQKLATLSFSSYVFS